MLKTSILCLFLFFCTPFLWGQAAHFDGHDDKATVYHHADFNLSTHDFTVEALVRDVALDKPMLTIISKRNSATNGFALMLDMHDGLQLIAEVGQDVYEVDASVFEDRGCHSVGLRRAGNEITLFIDDKEYSLGSNTENINTTENLLIGDDGSNTHQPFYGFIDEVRFWNIARKSEQIFDWNHKCMSPSTNGLLALWNLEENAGQFFHDLATVKHHAYLGSGFGSDAQDPLWTSEKCLEACCDGQAAFTVSAYTPLAAQWVNFTNVSTNTVAYEWSIDDLVVSNAPHFQYSFEIGVFVVRLKATSEGGCATYYSEVIEVTDNNFSHCGKETFTSAEIQALEEFENLNPIPNPLPTIKMYDRFGNRYSPNDVTIPSQQLESTGSTTWSCSCGIFELYFEDMFHNRDYGFDDPVLGADRRAVACRVFEDLSVLVNPSGTLTSNLVKIQIKKSEGQGPNELNPINALAPGILAVAGPYLIQTYNTGTIDGLVYKTIVSGTNALANTPGWNPSSYHGSIRVDFELPNYFLNNTNWTAPVPSNQMDLYSTLLHESLHVLGFYSLIDANTNLSILNGTQLYNRYDTYLENSAGTPYIDPATGILNPASNFVGTANCSADVTFNGNVNSNQTVYLPSPWNFSILSHFNCDAANNNACATGNGYIMNACIPPGGSQRTPSQEEYSTLCDIGYPLSGSYGNPAVGTPNNNNVPYQIYVSCSFPCPVAGVDDILPIIVPSGGTVTINDIDFLTNDNNPGGTYNLNTVLTSFGTITNVTASSFDFTADPNFLGGTAIIQYTPVCANGNNGSNALIYIQVLPPPLPACNLPPSSCNLLCFGDFENMPGTDAFGLTTDVWDNFYSTYDDSGNRTYGSHGGLNPHPAITTELIQFDVLTALTNWPLTHQSLYGCLGNLTYPALPLPIGFPNKNTYIGMASRRASYDNYDHIHLPLTKALDPSSNGVDNYRLTFWALTPCNDVQLRMVLSENPPCNDGRGNNLYNSADPTSLLVPPVCFGTFSGVAASCPTYTAVLNEGVVMNNTPDATGAYSWQQYTLDFHVTASNIQHVVFHPALGSGFYNPGNPSPCVPKYVVIDEMTIERITQPQLTVNSTLIGTACSGNKVIVEYDICSDVPVSGLDLEVQLPLGSGLLYTNALDFANGQITGLDLGIGGNPLCTLVQVEIEIPVGAAAPSTQSVVMDITGGTACTSTASSLTTDLNIEAGSSLALSVIPSVTGNVSIGSNFTVDVVVSNTGTTDVQNIVVELPSGLYSTGLNYALTSTTIPSIPAGTQHTISAVPVSVSGPCGNAQVCAEVVSGTGVCNLPSGCSPLLTVTGASTTSFPIEAENTAHTDPTLFSATATTSNDEIYSVGMFSNDIEFTEGIYTNTLVKNHSCSGAHSPFLVKYSSCGFEWAVEIPACNLLNFKALPDVEVGQNGEVYVAFSFTGSFTINGTTYTSQGGMDIALIKYDAAGTAIWVKTEGGVGEDWVTDIETYYNGTNEEIFIVGSLIGSAPNTVLFSSTTSINYNSAGNFCTACNFSGGTTYLASYTDNGTSTSMNWVNSLNSAATLSGRLSIDPIGNAYVMGATGASFTFNGSTVGVLTTPLNQGPPSSTNDDIDLFVLKYSNSGNELWAELYGGDGIDYGYTGTLFSFDFGFDVECEGTTHIGILFPKLDFNSTGPQSYMQDVGTHLLRLNSLNGSLDWIHPIATPTTGINSASNVTGNMTYYANLKIHGTNYLVNGSFLLIHPNAVHHLSGFTSIDFHGTVISHASMVPFSPIYNANYPGAFTMSVSNMGSMQWVNVNTSIGTLVPSSTSPTNTLNAIFSLINLDVETDNSGNIYAPFLLRGVTTLNTNNLTGGVSGVGTVFDGFLSKIDGTTGNNLRPAVNNAPTTVQAQDDSAPKGNNSPTLATSTIASNTNISTKLYPNPTTGKVTLEINSNLKNNQVERIIIYDVTGRQIQEINTEAQQTIFDINLNSQQSGVYFIKMLINQELITERVVLMK
jgi:hypothetical protein